MLKGTRRCIAVETLCHGHPSPICRQPLGHTYIVVAYVVMADGYPSVICLNPHGRFAVSAMLPKSRKTCRS